MNNVFYMKAALKIICIPVIALSVLVTGCGSSPANVPVWFTNTQLRYPDSEYIWVVGVGAVQEDAKRQAVIEMSQYFHTTVETVSRYITEYREIVSSAKNEFSEKIALDQYSRIESNEDFFGIRFTDVWFNSKRKEYAVLAYINRKDAEKLYHSRIETNMVGINALMADVAQNGDPLYSVKLLSNGKSIADITRKYIDNMSFIYPEKNQEYLKIYTPYLNTIQQLYSMHERLRNTRVSVTVEFRGNTQITEADKENMRQSVQEAIGLYNVPVQIDPDAAAGQSGYAFVFTVNSEPKTSSGLIETDLVLTFTHNGKTFTLPPARKNFKEYEQDIAGGIKRALSDIKKSSAFFQALTVEINRE
ncbi:hypothetical protein AGMMS49944_00680 [Spirochaetia bacterium]|nr:hypothetical protein AGMMS49944_00680 [Spirochaetia bacterium]